MNKPPFYMLAYDTDGTIIYNSPGGWCEWKFWNDACWSRCIPKDCTGLTYVDIGCSDGVFPMRFWQRGGKATGISPELAGVIYPGIEPSDTPGKNLTNESAQWLKERYSAGYDLLVGGFANNGKILPDIGRVNVVSCLNVLEYLPNPFDCIRHMFESATDMVIIATDINDQKTGKHRAHNNVTVFFPDDIAKQSSWDLRFFRLPLIMNRSPEPQGFWCFTRPGGAIPQPDGSEVVFDRTYRMSATQQTYLESLHDNRA